MNNRSIKEIHGISVVNTNFGIRRFVIEKVASRKEIVKFKGLLEEKNRLIFEAYREKKIPVWRQVRPIDSELRGYRKYWRTKYTDSFTDGLYKSTKRLSWQFGRCTGEFGTSWYNKVIDKGALLMYIRHDPLGNVELMHLDSNELIKVPRGNANCDSLIAVDGKEP